MAVTAVGIGGGMVPRNVCDAVTRPRAPRLTIQAHSPRIEWPGCSRPPKRIDSKSNLLRRSFLPLLRRTGLPTIRFHDLRHTAATLLLAQGVHPKIVQERLGLSQIALTLDTYSHVLPGMGREERPSSTRS